MFHAILYLLPVVVLALPLLARRYPGERALIALRRMEQGVRWTRPRSSMPVRRRVVVVLVRGGRLIGRSLAVRPPPTLSLTS